MSSRLSLEFPHILTLAFEGEDDIADFLGRISKIPILFSSTFLTFFLSCTNEELFYERKEREFSKNWLSELVGKINPDADSTMDREEKQKNIDQLIRAGGLFKQDLDREGLIDLFSPAHPELQAFRRSRFILYLEAAERKKLDDTPKPAIDLPPMHMVLHTPIWDRLQSSYHDVNAELQLSQNL